jgi:hypothetical protein
MFPLALAYLSWGVVKAAAWPEPRAKPLRKRALMQTVSVVPTISASAGRQPEESDGGL